MDRREALKKLAVGGTGVVGAAIVTSSRAFAYGQPTPPANPSPFTVVNSNPTFFGSFLNATITFGPGVATCPSSVPAANSTILNWDYLISNVSATGVTFVPATLNLPLVTAGNVSFTAVGVIFVSGSFTVAFRARYRCTRGAVVKTVCRSWMYNFTRAAGGNWAFGVATVGTTCPD